MGAKVVVEVNQQQAQLLDRLIAEGYGSSYGEVIRAGFRAFCEAHPEIVARGEAGQAKKRSKGKGAKSRG